jgi:hypothetical protein
MLSFAHVMNFFADKFSRLGRRRFSLPFVAACVLDRLSFGHFWPPFSGVGRVCKEAILMPSARKSADSGTSQCCSLVL